jgi:hypothetical protein
MSTARPWGALDPNSQHQLWSRWTFTVWDNGKHPPYKEVRQNAAAWLRKGFGSVGHAHVDEKVSTWVIIAEVEGAPAHDPDFVKSVERQFQKHFVEKGWGPLAISTVEVRILAGDTQTGKPPDQLIVMPADRFLIGGIH